MLKITFVISGMILSVFNQQAMDFPLIPNKSTCLYFESNRGINLRETKIILENMGNTYEPEPKDISAPLDKKYVLNYYWSSISAQHQQIKDAALVDILNLNFTHWGYPLQRYHIAGAAYAGANPNCKGDDKNFGHCLANSLGYNDYPLCALLLSKGANPNVKIGGKPTLHYARTKPIAKLLFLYGAKIKKIPDLICFLITCTHDADLIPFYKKKGISFLETKENNITSLMWLAMSAHNHHEPSECIQKAKAIFAGLHENKIVQLIHEKQRNNGETAMQLLTQGYQHESKAALAQFLQSYIDKRNAISQIKEADDEQALCPICFTEKADFVTDCNHGFCKTCIASWMSINKTCPKCRKELKLYGK